MSPLTPIYGEPVTSGPDSGSDSQSRKLKINVVFTSIEGTVAALIAAATYARTLSAQIVIHVPHVMSFRYPLERPPVSPAHFEKLCFALVEEAAVNPDRVAIEVHSCRSQLSCLTERLTPQSLVVIGGLRARWVRREKRLASDLGKLGHDVMLVYASVNSAGTHTFSVIQRMLPI